MNPKVVPQADVKTRLGLASLGAVVVAGVMSLVLAGTALSAPAIGKDGQIHACYRVKGKAKGAMRVTPPGKGCKRGERKLAWSVVGPAGPQGANGAQGGQGTQGAGGNAGSNGTSGSGNVALETKVAALTLQVKSLEETLQGVTNGQLTGAIGTVAGLTNSDLTDVVGKLDGITGLQLTNAVGSVPAVTALCAQANALPGQVNGALSSAFGGLSLEGVIPLGLLLKVPNLTTLPSFTC